MTTQQIHFFGETQPPQQPEPADSSRKRVFLYDGQVFEDPGPDYSVQDIVSHDWIKAANRILTHYRKILTEEFKEKDCTHPEHKARLMQRANHFISQAEQHAPPTSVVSVGISWVTSKLISGEISNTTADEYVGIV